jgi:prepilin-type N-terminal cleavage/methylation domain-containing protein
MNRSPGFTLLELLVVIGVLSVLMGFAIGFLKKTDPQAVADSVLAGELRQAQFTARAEGVPTEVFLRPGVDGAPATVQSRLLQPVVSFHFEPGDVVLDESLRPMLGGEDRPAGRFGHARTPKVGDKLPLLRWPAPKAVLDLGSGFVVRFELVLDNDGKPRARLRLVADGGDGTTLATAVAEEALPLHRWCTLDVGCDGNALWLALDGAELARTAAAGSPQQGDDPMFEVVPADAPFTGAVDEVRWFVYTFAPAQFLPHELPLEKPLRFAFDARGEAIERPVVRFQTAGEGS